MIYNLHTLSIHILNSLQLYKKRVFSYDMSKSDKTLNFCVIEESNYFCLAFSKL